MSRQSKDQQVKHVVEGLALGVLAQDVEAVTSAKMELEFAFNSAWRKWSRASEFPNIGSHDPGNVFWKQGQLANKVFAALDGKQQEKALLEKSPADDPKTIRIKKDGWVGLCVGELSKDQKGLVEETLKEILAPYRESDVASAMALIKEGGGLDKVHLAFYQDGDLGSDKVWDRFKIEGPTMSWYFRGSPHVHTWVNIGRAT